MKLTPDTDFKVTPRKKPVVMYEYDALAKARFLVGKVTTECQWFHQLHRIETDKNIIYHLTDMVIPPQTAQAAYVESDDMQQYKLRTLIKSRMENPDDTEAYNAIFSKLSAWCHSHVRMEPSPSGTDRTQFEERIEDYASSLNNKHQPVMMLILNKNDKVHVEIWDPIEGQFFVNPPQIIHYPNVDTDSVEEEIKERVEEKKYTAPVGHTHWQNNLHTTRTYRGAGATPQRAVTSAPTAPSGKAISPQAEGTESPGGGSSSSEYDVDEALNRAARKIQKVARKGLKRFFHQNNPADKVEFIVNALLNSVGTAAGKAKAEGFWLHARTIIFGEESEIWLLTSPSEAEPSLEKLSKTEIRDAIVRDDIDEELFVTAMTYALAISSDSDIGNRVELIDDLTNTLMGVEDDDESEKSCEKCSLRQMCYERDQEADTCPHYVE